MTSITECPAAKLDVKQKIKTRNTFVSILLYFITAKWCSVLINPIKPRNMELAEWLVHWALELGFAGSMRSQAIFYDACNSVI